MVVLGWVIGDLVTKAELALDLDEVLHMHARAESMTATAALRGLFEPANVLVEADAQLSRPLEDVEELAERQPQERADNSDCVQNGDEAIGVTCHIQV